MGHDHKYLLRTNLSFLLILTGTVVTVSGQSLSPLFVSKDVSGKTSNDSRIRRQAREDFCEFGTVPNLSNCNYWNNRNGTTLKWELGAGTLSNWLGGPNKDASVAEDAEKGGYMFFETSLLSAPVLRVDEIIREGQNAYIESVTQGSTGPEGKCVQFSFAVDGLSAAGLRVILQPVTKDNRPDGFFRVLWGTKDPTYKMWMTAEILYTFNKEHQIVFEGVAKELQDAFRKYRGYVAIDSVNIKNGADCRGHCTFEGGFCRWGRGSKNPSTGPATDRSSFIYGGMEGGYAFIDSSYPRRPGDIAKLSSEEFDSTGPDSPMCMRFWTHMFGNGIGTLSILLVDSQNNQNERELWSLSGEAGNAWYQAEVTIASPNPFRIVLSAKVGKNNLGDIAVDDISLTPGSCPTAPQIAASNGDCTFEVDECGWSNVVSRERLDDIDWERTSGAALRSAVHDHTLGTEKGYLMTLSRSTVQRPGSRAWFTSRDFKTNAVPRCLSFWFIMNEPFIDAAGPSLGAVSVFTKTMEKDGTITMKPIWRLYNHQGPDWTYAQALISEPNDAIVIEGIWGSSRANGFIAFDDITFFSSSCTVFPKGAVVRPGECHFERDMCDWTNGTEGKPSAAAWRMATASRRPANLPDKTFGAPDGYIYFDLFNQILGSNMVRLVSPVITTNEGDSQLLCFSFWYAAFGAGESAILQIIRQDNSSDTSEKIWSLEARNMDTTRPAWMPAQVGVDASRGPFRLILEGQATNGGFAIDDLSFTASGSNCPTRPEKAGIQAQALKAG
ncbi:hypothetical protein M8J75_013844 [Diaphorina citri]|nr:hypothetical protein M8J75_013844 [Diaphorina citri]